MSDNQLTLSAPPDDDTRIVESFIDASRDLIPTVQVSLAKRIIRPGSNRVLCLAAQTSVPLNEDEMASVSDLALRLSDGTNVNLSLSFFNDMDGGVQVLEHEPPRRANPKCIPMTRSFFDPNRYAPYKAKNDSKLGMAIWSVVLGLTLGIYAGFEGPFSKRGLKQSTSILSNRSEGKKVSSSKTPFLARKQTNSVTNIASAAFVPDVLAVGAGRRSVGAERRQAIRSSTSSIRKSRNEVPVDSELGQEASRFVAPKLRTFESRSSVSAAPVEASPAVRSRSTFDSGIPSITFMPTMIEGSTKNSRKHKQPNNMFVPPPPPTAYTYDPAAYPPFMQWPMPVGRSIDAQSGQASAKVPAAPVAQMPQQLKAPLAINAKSTITSLAPAGVSSNAQFTQLGLQPEASYTRKKPIGGTAEWTQPAQNRDLSRVSKSAPISALTSVSGSGSAPSAGSTSAAGSLSNSASTSPSVSPPLSATDVSSRGKPVFIREYPPAAHSSAQDHSTNAAVPLAPLPGTEQAYSFERIVIPGQQ